MLGASFLRWVKVGLLHTIAVVSLVMMMTAPTHASTVTEEIILRKTNTERSIKSLDGLAYDKRLAQSAQAKAEHMVAHDYWAHDAPDGTQPWGFMHDAGVTYVAAGENLARGFSNANILTNAWMESPMHRANILNESFTHIGVGIHSGVLEGVETTVVVAHYAAPRHNPVISDSQADRLTVDEVFKRSRVAFWHIVRFANKPLSL